MNIAAIDITGHAMKQPGIISLLGVHATNTILGQPDATVTVETVWQNLD